MKPFQMIAEATPDEKREVETGDKKHPPKKSRGIIFFGENIRFSFRQQRNDNPQNVRKFERIESFRRFHPI